MIDAMAKAVAVIIVLCVMALIVGGTIKLLGVMF